MIIDLVLGGASGIVQIVGDAPVAASSIIFDIDSIFRSFFAAWKHRILDLHWITPRIAQLFIPD